MALELQTFVFIDEDQQQKYSKTTLSAINAQVAKYAHKQRKVVPKARSAPSSPPSTGASKKDQSAVTASTQDDQLNASFKRTLDLSVKNGRRRSADLQKPSNHARACSGKDRRKSLPQSKPTRESQYGPEVPKQAESTEENNEGGREELAELFDKLCHVNKSPTYQAFPFFLDLEERKLAHYWIINFLREDFGMKLQLETSFQGHLTKYAFAFQVPLRWMIARAAHQLNEKTGSQSLTVVYKNREAALNKLQEILNDENSSIDEVIGSIHHTIVHSPEFRKLHIRGMDAIIESKGGLENVLKQCTITCPEHIFSQYTFAEFDITQLEELEALKTTFFESLISMQTHAKEYTTMVSQMSGWASSVDLIDCTFVGGNLQKWSYTEQRKRVFSAETALGQLARQEYDIFAEFARKARLFSALFQLNALLIEFDTIDQKSLFLRRLESAVQAAANPHPITGMPVMLGGTHIYVAGHTSRQVQEELGGERYDAKGIPVAKAAIAAIKLFSLFLDSMKRRLIQYLQAWLLGDDRLVLSSSDVSAMSTVITQLWLQKMRNSSDSEATDYFSP